MIRPIMKDIFFLNQRSKPATEADKQVAVDLLDTLKAHEEGCVGMAANMIGEEMYHSRQYGIHECGNVQSEDCKTFRKI